MKKIGMIGGLSYQSTIDYYKVANERSMEILGVGNATCEILIHSVNLEEMLGYAGAGEVETLAKRLSEVAAGLEKSGAEVIVLCTNTMHMVAPEIEAAISVPFIHITDATAAEIKKCGIKKVGLLGTPFTMSQPFYKDRLMEKHGIETVIPDQKHFDEIFRIIAEELTVGIIRDESREYLLKVSKELEAEGACGIILGCTEIPMIIKPGHSDIPVFDTATIHALAAVEAAL